MAKQKRKSAKVKPVTSHQLFPAVVALWFGALFGLGSLAVRPSLLEGLVLKTHLDLVIPAAAPPLGVTARILVALIMAALGALIGIALARRITKPKPIATERKRSGRDFGRNENAPRSHYADASTRPPVLSRGELGEELDSAGGGGVLAARRRALAIEPEEEAFVPHEMAPLPGGSPQIFDISEIGIEESEPAPLTTFAEPAPVAPVDLDWSNAAPLSTATAPVAMPIDNESQRQVFQAEAAPVAVPEPCPAGQAAHAAGRQVFGMEPLAPQVETPRQIFGATVVGDHVDQDFIKAAGFKTTVFEQEETQPLFGPRPALGTEGLEATVAAPAPVVSEPAHVAAPVPEAFVPEPASAAEVAPPASDDPLPSPGSLGMTDLAARLAESMRRRRAARAGAGTTEASAPEAAAPSPLPAEPAFAPAPIPAAFEAPAAPQTVDPVLTAAAIPQAYEPPVAAPVSPEPVAPAPLAAIVQQPDAAPAEPQAEAALPEAPTSSPALPRAMQPLALDAFIEEDAALDPSLLPPRHIVMPVAPAQPAEVAAPAPEAPPLELGAENEVTEEAADEDNYASLLEIAPARNPFVRIDEPVTAGAEIEPVVIFPGQPAAAVAIEESASFRRFDAPSAAGQGQPVAVSTAAPAVDPAEAERALRSALSNLQRMSGAA